MGGRYVDILQRVSTLEVEMVVDVELGSDTVANTVFRFSPLHEVVSWVRLVLSGSRHPHLGYPSDRDRDMLRHPDVALLASLVDGIFYIPDFITPKPGGTCVQPAGTTCEHSDEVPRSLQSQLGAVAATDPTAALAQAEKHWQVGSRNSLGRVPRDHDGKNEYSARRVVSGQELVDRTARGLQLVAQAMRPRWPAIGATVASAVASRSEQVGAAGLADTLNDLHPQLRWSRGHLVIAKTFDETITFSGQELVVCPSAVEHERLLVQVCDPENATIIVPAHSILLGSRSATPYGPSAHRRGTRFQDSVDRTGGDETLPDALAGVLGTSRARILREVARPATTTELSAELGLAKSTVAHHLAHLLDAGFVTATRRGKQVLYRQSSRARLVLSEQVG